MLEGGSTTTEVERMRRENTRLTWGCYVPDGLDPAERYRQHCAAVLERLQPTAALAGPSAAVFHDLPLVGEMPGEVFVRNVTRGRYADDVVVLPEGPAADLVGVAVSTPATMVMDCARVLGSREALIVADAALAAGLCSQDDLQDAAHSSTGRRGAKRMRWVVANSDPLSESPGETWVRLVATGLGYELASQVEVRQAERAARLDFLVNGTMIALEFDGAVKYKRQGGVKVIQQLLRDGDLQAMGYSVLHFVWQQMSNTKQFDARLRHAGARPVRRARHMAW